MRPTLLITMPAGAARKLAATVAERRGYAVFTASTARGALRQVGAHPEITFLLAEVTFETQADIVHLAEAAKPLRPELEILVTFGLTRRINEIAGGRPVSAVLGDPVSETQVAEILEALLERQP